MATQAKPQMSRDLQSGQRLHCARCGAEIEIVQPCPSRSPDQSFRCCGREMQPTIGRDVHVGDE
jgi:hypothetical protein